MKLYLLKMRQTAKSCGAYIRVNNKTTVNSNTSIGDNVSFNGLQIIGEGEVFIGSNIHFAPDCIIITQNHNYEGDKLPFDEVNIIKKTTINDNVWVGQRVTILPGVEIGEGAIIQAGSVVVSDIPACAIAGGHPAKVFNHRDKNRYNMLKEKMSYISR